MSERGLAARIALRENPAGGDAGGFAPFEPPRRARGAGWQRWQMGSLDPRAALQEIVQEAPAEPAPPPIDFAALDALGDFLNGKINEHDRVLCYNAHQH